MRPKKGPAGLDAWKAFIFPRSKIWSFPLSGGMSLETFGRTLAVVEPKEDEPAAQP